MIQKEAKVVSDQQAPINFFEILSLEENFEIDKNQLDNNYFAALAKYHPDRAPDPAKKKYASFSNILNLAYEALGDDFKRASHILQLHNINIQSDATAPRLPLEILQEVLEMQESLEDQDKVDEVKKKALSLKEEILKELKTLFASKNYELASIKTMHLKYILKIMV